MERIKFDLNQFLRAMSFAIDFVEMDILGASRNHSKRVAYISLRIAEALNVGEDERCDILAFSIMHDNGLSQESMITKIPYEKLRQLKRIETLTEHCDFGEKNISNYPFITSENNIIRYHHEKWDGNGFFGLKGDEIPLLAQIIGLADFIDNVYHFENGNSKQIEEYLKNNRDIHFSSEIVDAYMQISSHPAFWLDLKNEFINLALDRHSIPNIQNLKWDEIYEIIHVFTNIIDSNSNFTGRHSAEIVDKVITACEYYEIGGDERIKLMISAALHDLGKLAMPQNILEKPKSLDYSERKHMQAHTYYTKLALSCVDHFDQIKEWAGNHHEKLNGSGYPEGLSADQLDFNSRLMCCIDLYQALTEDRPYRSKMSLEKAYGIMEKMVRNRYIDGDIVKGVIKYMVDNSIGA